ncbi:MAG: hypothetical protein PHV34_12790 [Verrucomicrobiae bacterium]|nr:hypothetical protein [Verrucomicrobiae bacterium]
MVSAIVGSVAAWTRRYCPLVFAGSEKLACDFAIRFLAGQIHEGFRLVDAVQKAEPARHGSGVA